MTAAGSSALPRWGRGDAVATWGAYAAVFVTALAARLAVVLVSPGRPCGTFGYDSSVYFTASTALIHGRLPYRDFVFLHPPGVVLALTPFAWLGRLTTDHTGFVAAVLAFALLGRGHPAAHAGDNRVQYG